MRNLLFFISVYCCSFSLVHAAAAKKEAEEVVNLDDGGYEHLSGSLLPIKPMGPLTRSKLDELLACDWGKGDELNSRISDAHRNFIVDCCNSSPTNMPAAIRSDELHKRVIKDIIPYILNLTMGYDFRIEAYMKAQLNRLNAYIPTLQKLTETFARWMSQKEGFNIRYGLYQDDGNKFCMGYFYTIFGYLPFIAPGVSPFTSPIQPLSPNFSIKNSSLVFNFGSTNKTFLLPIRGGKVIEEPGIFVLSIPTPERREDRVFGYYGVGGANAFQQTIGQFSGDDLDSARILLGDLYPEIIEGSTPEEVSRSHLNAFQLMRVVAASITASARQTVVKFFPIPKNRLEWVEFSEALIQHFQKSDDDSVRQGLSLLLGDKAPEDVLAVLRREGHLPSLEGRGSGAGAGSLAEESKRAVEAARKRKEEVSVRARAATAQSVEATTTLTKHQNALLQEKGSEKPETGELIQKRKNKIKKIKAKVRRARTRAEAAKLEAEKARELLKKAHNELEFAEKKLKRRKAALLSALEGKKRWSPVIKLLERFCIYMVRGRGSHHTFVMKDPETGKVLATDGMSRSHGSDPLHSLIRNTKSMVEALFTKVNKSSSRI